MDALPGRLAPTSPDNSAVALRLLKGLEECRQMSPAEAEAWRRRIEGCARFIAVGAGAESSAYTRWPPPVRLRREESFCRSIARSLQL